MGWWSVVNGFFRTICQLHLAAGALGVPGVRVVFDTSVVVAGAGWRGESHLCLVALAKPFGIEIVTPRQLLSRLQRPL